MSAKPHTTNQTRTFLIILGVIVALLLTWNSGVFTAGLVDAEGDVTIEKVFAKTDNTEVDDVSISEKTLRFGTAVLKFSKGVIGRLPELSK